MQKVNIYLLLFVLITVQTVWASPRLTVVIAVDGLRSDNIEYMRNYWLPGGLRTLQEDAAQTQLTFDFNVQGGEETLATLLTGVQPCTHGLSFNHIFSRKDKQIHSFFEDKSEKGIGTKEQVSLRQMPVPTVSDLYRIRYGKSKKWATSTYYANGLPLAADKENMSSRKADSYAMPKCNSMVVDLALRIQEQEMMGKDDTPDLLLLHFSLERESAVTDCIQGKDEEDIHQALNQYTGFLIEQLQKRVGKENVQFIVTGIPRHGQSAAQMERIGIPIHSFNLGRATALTSVYLMAIYGYEKWIDGCYGQSVYLNRTLIEEKGLDLQKIERQVADFLTDFEGVQAAYPRHEALLVPDLTIGLAKSYIGDVVVSLQPSWRMMADDENEVDHVMDSRVDVPLYWLRPNEKTTLPTPLRATELIHILQQ